MGRCILSRPYGMIQGFSVWAALCVWMCLTLPAALYAGFEGFGSGIPGGSGGVVVYVTSLADSGPGTLREALNEGNRQIVFQVGGVIYLRKGISIKGKSFITIKGSTAPSPGITLVGHGLYIRESHDIVVESIRVRDSAQDGITIKNGSYNIVIDHCSIANSRDENIGITNNSRDVTVSWSLIGDAGWDSFARRSKGMLVANFEKAPATRISIHHNLIANQSQRSPQISTPGLFDIRNNLIWNWNSYGIRVRNGARGNIIANDFKSAANPQNAIIVAHDAGPVFIKGNRGPRGINLEGRSMISAPYEVGRVLTDPVELVEEKVARKAGVFPRDEVDAFLAGSGP